MRKRFEKPKIMSNYSDSADVCWMLLKEAIGDSEQSAREMFDYAFSAAYKMGLADAKKTRESQQPLP